MKLSVQEKVSALILDSENCVFTADGFSLNSGFTIFFWCTPEKPLLEGMARYAVELLASVEGFLYCFGPL